MKEERRNKKGGEQATTPPQLQQQKEDRREEKKKEERMEKRSGAKGKSHALSPLSRNGEGQLRVTSSPPPFHARHAHHFRHTPHDSQVPARHAIPAGGVRAQPPPPCTAPFQTPRQALPVAWRDAWMA